MSEETQRKMFGMTVSEVISEKPKYERPGMWAMSILSDVQEMLARSGSESTRETVRQFINKAKYWIDQADSTR